MNLLLYGYTLSDAPHDLRDLKGVDGERAFMVSVGEVSAVVSQYGREGLSARGQDLVDFERVIRHLMLEASIMPLDFGLTLRELSFVENVLQKNHDALRDELHRLYRKVEMHLTMSFCIDDLFAYLKAKHKSVQDSQARFINSKLVYNIGERARKCAPFEKALRKEKEARAQQVAELIGPWCSEFEQKINDSVERSVASFRCLVNRERLKVFERSIAQAIELYGEEMEFGYTGPWAPQGFCRLSEIKYA